MHSNKIGEKIMSSAELLCVASTSRTFIVLVLKASHD